MKAVVLQNGTLAVEDVPEPAPGEGQLLLATRTCGICGTDLHARHHMDTYLQGLAAAGMPLPVDRDAGMVMGHEFCGEVIGRGPDTSGRIGDGRLVVALPFVTGAAGAEYVGYSNRFPGGFGERMVITEKLAFEVPNGLAARQAAMTEPFAVGAHAVARANIGMDPCAIMVVGCGPIGLAVIAALKAKGLGPVVGMDFSPGRRRFAEAMGADEVVDAGAETQASVWSRHGAGRKGRRAVVFECVGRPGVAQSIIDEVPRGAKVVVVGNSLEPCTLDQVKAFNLELEIVFAMNYSPGEFGATLADIADGRIDTAAMLTGIVPPEGVEQAFADLRDGERHAKIMVSFE
ncbi:MAG: zinc-binding dehydrogenase [Novosphingobium sp.]|nr:zinc-binding dehydrogenase [Novosphingobium sp.]